MLAVADAVKFADGSDVTVSVRVVATVAPDGSAGHAMSLSVADGGRGMTDDECVHCFDPYVCSPTQRGGGTGLGTCCRKP